jgi:hypothetical protein
MIPRAILSSSCLVLSLRALTACGTQAGAGTAAPAPGPAVSPVSGPPVPVSAVRCGLPATSRPGRPSSPAATPSAWVGVVWCPVRILHGREQGPRPSPVIRRTDVTELVRALSAPPRSAQSVPCAPVAVDLATFWLLDADSRAWRPKLPKDPCLDRLRAVGKALSSVVAARPDPDGKP